MKRILKILLIGVMVLFPNVIHAKENITKEEADQFMNLIAIENTNRFGDWFGMYYQKDKITIDSLENQFKLYLAARTFNKEKPDEGSNAATIVVSQAEMNTAMKKIFGPDIRYTDESINVDKTLLAEGTYNKEKKEYTLVFDHTWGDAFFDGYPVYISKRTSQAKDDDKIEITEKAFYYEEFLKEKTEDHFYIKTYRISPKTFIKTMDKKTNAAYDEEYFKVLGDYIDSYKYTFKKANDGEYYFYSVENLKDAKKYKTNNTKVTETKKEKNPKTADSNIIVISMTGIVCLALIIICSKKVLKK